jgi:membrane protease YdiL (CAAX protease family)
VAPPSRLAALLVGDPPAYAPGPGDLRSLNLVGIRVPLRAGTFLLVTTALLYVNRSLDILPAYGPIDPRSIRDKAIERLVEFGLLPLLLLLATRDDPRRYGLGLGDVRRGVLLTGLLLLGTLPVIALLAANLPALRAFYGPQYTSVPDVLLSCTLELFAAEFLLRGFLMFALFRAIGPAGLVVAVVPFVFQHLDKPAVEALSTLGGGLVFGWLNWRTGSIWYSGAYHVAIQALAVIVAGGASGA